MGTDLVKSNPRFAIKKVGLAAKLEGAQSALMLDVPTMTNRIGIIFDDSGSMAGKEINDAHDGIDAFVKNCNSADTALALYPLNMPSKSLTLDFADIALYGKNIPATGGTPLYSKLLQLINMEPITRAIAFSDGGPTDQEEDSIPAYIKKKIPIDTVYLGSSENDPGAVVMKSIAERTGGIFLHFTDTSVFAKAFKYLTPAYRAMLTSGTIDKKKLERGEL